MHSILCIRLVLIFIDRFAKVQPRFRPLQTRPLFYKPKCMLLVDLRLKALVCGRAKGRLQILDAPSDAYGIGGVSNGFSTFGEAGGLLRYLI
jgi:hypothetical protein